MSVEPITSRRNPLVRELRELSQPSGRLRQQRLLLEGTHLLQEVLRLELAPDLLLATPPWMARHDALLRALPAATLCREASPEVIEAVATTRHPDGVVLTLPWTLPGGSLPPTPPSFGLLLANIQDPGNLGTLLRTAWAAGVDQVWLCEGADPWQPKVLRASSGASLALAIGRFSPDALPARLREIRRAGTAVVGTVARGGTPYWSHDWRQPTLVMLGNEGSGLSPSLLEGADGLLTVPIDPAVDSLNVAIASAPLLLERRRQSLGAGAITTDLGP
ncbi:MAG: TrmH family RNA methyltransferase [Cyanobacteriota bacterium]